MFIGDRIRKISEVLQISLSELADLLGITAQNLSVYVNNRRQPKSIFLQHFKKIGVNIDWLLTGKGDMFIDNSIKDKLILQELNKTNKYENIVNSIFSRLDNLENLANKDYSTNSNEGITNNLIERIETLENKINSLNIDEATINNIFQRIENLENYITIKDKIIEYLIENLERYKNENK